MTTLQPLGRREPVDWAHVEKYPLRALVQADRPSCVPVAWGVNWYSNFDTPVKFDNRWWIGRGDLGSIRGGHAVCSPTQHPRQKDVIGWWEFYDQGQEGACVGFATSRMMSLLNRKRYAAFWLYKEAQKIDPWPGENYSGTAVSAALDVLRTRGHCIYRKGVAHIEHPSEGISANRWAITINEVLDALGSKYYRQYGAIPFLNSWGRAYPRIVWMSIERWDQLLQEGGECGLVTDK